MKIRFMLFILIVLIAEVQFALAGANSSKHIVIEIGEDFTVKNIKKKLWIENQKVVKASSKNGAVTMRAQTIGSSKVRIDHEIYILNVVPVGYKQSYELWQKYSYRFADIKVGFCDNTICLMGQLSSYKEFLKIVRIMEENNSPMYLNLRTSDEIKSLINHWYHQYFRENGLTPIKILYAKPWRVFMNQQEKSKGDMRDILQKVGLLVIENKQKINIADNVRVEIQITEVKKEFVQELGIKWPETYNAQILNLNQLNSNLNNKLDLNLNAFERNGDMKILASPNLICRSGKSAEFFAGGEFPIITKDGKNQKTVIWKKYGIALKIKPVVDSVGQMSIELETEISSLDKTKEIEGIPAMHTHKVVSHFDLRESKTIALSGLIKNESGSTTEGLPGLSQLPVIGRLFSSQSFLENKTELVIFVTPRLME